MREVNSGSGSTIRWFVMGLVVTCLVPTTPTLAAAIDPIWNFKITNNTVANANDLELIFSGTGGGIASPSINSINNGTPGAGVSAKVANGGNGINIAFGSNGFKMGSTLLLSFSTPSASDIVSFSKGTWTRTVNDPVDVPPSSVTVADLGGGSLWRVMGTNNSQLAADDFEATFTGAGGSISNAMVTMNAPGAGSASALGSGDMVSVNWDAPGLPNGGLFTFTFQTNPGSTVSLADAEWSNNVGVGDGAQVSAVPEPSSLALAGAGMLGLLALRRKRHTK